MLDPCLATNGMTNLEPELAYFHDLPYPCYFCQDLEWGQMSSPTASSKNTDVAPQLAPVLQTVSTTSEKHEQHDCVTSLTQPLVHPLSPSTQCSTIALSFSSVVGLYNGSALKGALWCLKFNPLTERRSARGAEGRENPRMEQQHDLKACGPAHWYVWAVA